MMQQVNLKPIRYWAKAGMSQEGQEPGVELSISLFAVVPVAQRLKQGAAGPGSDGYCSLAGK